MAEKEPLPVSENGRRHIGIRVTNLADIITYAKFQDGIFTGYDFTGGRIFHFSIDFCMSLTTVQRYCAACDR